MWVRFKKSFLYLLLISLPEELVSSLPIILSNDSDPSGSKNNGSAITSSSSSFNL